MGNLAQIYRYRELLHIRDTGGALDIGDVLSLEELESRLRDSAPLADLTAILTLGEDEHCVNITRLSSEGVVCTNGPQLSPGTTLGVCIDDPEHNHSYRFHVEVTWLRLAQGYEVGLSFVGRPVVLRWGPGRGRAADAVVELENTLRAA